LGHCTTSRIVAGSIPDEVIDFFFKLPIPFIHIIALGFTQPLTEMSTRNSFWDKALPMRKANNLTAICEQVV
jgi:hypothetical protein